MLVGQPGGTLRFPFPRRSPRFARLRAPHGGHALLWRRFTPRTIFMEIGGGGCELALRAAGYVERAYAVDVAAQLVQGTLLPVNLRLVLCDGVRIPVPESSVDIAFSDCFTERLSADELVEHLKGVLRALAPGGRYVCLAREGLKLRAAMLAAGFSAVRCYARSVRVPWALARFLPDRRLGIDGSK